MLDKTVPKEIFTTEKPLVQIIAKANNWQSSSTVNSVSTLFQLPYIYIYIYIYIYCEYVSLTDRSQRWLYLFSLDMLKSMKCWKI